MLDVQLKILKTIVEQKSFSKAAEMLHMTQSSVSQQIQHLEGYYGVKLFDRFYRRIHATPAGEALYPYAVQIDRLYQEAEKTLQKFSGDISGRLHIGASLTIGDYILPEILVAFRQQYPKVDIAMEVCNTEEVAGKVRDGTLNVGFIEGPFVSSDRLSGKPCGGDSLVVIAAGTAREQKPAAMLPELMRENWVMRESISGTRRVFEQFLQDHGHDPSALQVVMELGSTQAIKEAVKAGLGISVLSRRAVEAEFNQGTLREIPLAEGEIIRPFSLLYHKDKFRPYTVEMFLAFALSKLNAQQPNQ